ncbi:MAG: L-threonylcarbamoyladenylate synthase [Verrucomicrobiota bacterium]|nr:L-threonylcarbamoyladenylate synthase [Verrucomicrobiota bacterium]
MTSALQVFGDRAEDVVRVAELLVSGEVVAVPTETVYGLAADALNESACRRIFEIKGRPLIDPLIVHVEDVSQAGDLAVLSRAFERLAEIFWPGPLTVVLPKRGKVPAIVTAGLDSVAVRAPRHPLIRKILHAAKIPLAAPSANPFGYISPTRAEHVAKSLAGRIQYLVDGGACEVGVESTIIDLCEPLSPTLLRPGSILPETIESVLGQRLRRPASAQKSSAQRAPGLLEQHYSPRTPLRILPTSHPSANPWRDGDAVIFISRAAHPEPATGCSTYWLSENGDLADAARQLYHLLNQLDVNNHGTLWIEQPQQSGLGLTLNDRIGRAAAKDTNS